MSLLRKIVTLGFTACLAWAANAQNGRNPIADFYTGAEGFPTWTQQVKWGNTINMATFTGGSTEFEKFENARDQLYAQGGGVLYYPAGTYNFDIPNRGPNGRGLMLKKGVVIVGDRPQGDDRAIKTQAQSRDSLSVHGLQNMPTKFVFTDSIVNTPSGGSGRIPFTWNMIGMMKGSNETNLGQISHVGIAWIQLEKAYIYFGFGRDSSYAQTWGESTCWLGGFNANTQQPNGRVVNGWNSRIPNGTHPMDAFVGCKQMGVSNSVLAEKIFVFGVRMVNALCPNYQLDRSGQFGNDFLESSGWRFGARMGVHGRHLFIGNNVVDKPTASFVTQVKVGGNGGHGSGIVPFSSATGTVRNILFDYGYGIGIDVNKSHASFMWNRCAYLDTNSLFYAPNVVVRDNWVYSHGHKGFEISGKWGVIRNNINARDFHRHNTSPYPGVTDQFNGYVNYSNSKYWTSESVDDNMSRAFDMAGANLWLDKNNYGPTGSTTANDGEGIMWQPHNGVDVFSTALTNNYKSSGGDGGYIAPYDCDIIGLLHFNNVNETAGATGAVKIDNHEMSDLSFVNNYNNVARTVPSNPSGVGPGGAPSGPNMRDVLSTCPANPGTAPIVTTTYDVTKAAIIINWQDRTSDEVGYRIDRKRPSDANWATIAYRPRQETPGTWFWPASTRGDYGPKPHGCGNITEDFNPAEWHDYLFGSDTTVEYRVLAFNCPEDPITAGSGGTIQTPNSVSTVVSVPSFRVYPNPTRDYIQIGFHNKHAATAIVKLYDATGRMVETKLFNGDNCDYKVQTSHLPKGAYNLVFTAGPNTYKTRVVVE